MLSSVHLHLFVCDCLFASTGSFMLPIIKKKKKVPRVLLCGETLSSTHAVDLQYEYECRCASVRPVQLVCGETLKK